MAVLLLAAAAALAPAPKIPGRYGGDFWPGLVGYSAIGLLLLEVGRHAGRIVEWWSSMDARRRNLLAALTVAATLAMTLALRGWAPRTFGRLSRETGLWEPLSLLAYWGGAILIQRSLPRDAASDVRRPWLAVAAGYAFLGFEEIDWFSIFGGLIGRIDGVYAGSLHDLIRLVAEDVLSPAGLAAVAAVLVGVAILLWRTGWLEPRFLARLAARPEFAWFAMGFTLLWVAASEEAHLFGWVARPPTPEEAVEMAGALCLAVYALEISVREPIRRSRPPAAHEISRSR